MNRHISSRNCIRTIIAIAIAIVAGCTEINKVVTPTQASYIVEPLLISATEPSLTFSPESNGTPETTPTPNNLQNIEIATAKSPEEPIVSQEYLDQEGVFLASSVVKKNFLSWQSRVVSKPSNAKAWGILSTDQSGHKYLTPFFEVLDGDNPISENLVIPGLQGLNDSIYIIPLQNLYIKAPDGKQYAALVMPNDQSSNSDVITPTKPYIWTPFSYSEISRMTPEERADTPIYFSAFGQIDEISSQHEAPNNSDLRKVLLNFKLLPTATITPDITPIENISPQNEGLVNMMNNYILPRTGTDKNIGPQIILRMFNAMNKSEIISFETLHEQVNATGKPIIVDGVNPSKYPPLCVSKKQDNVFQQQGVSILVFHDGVKLTLIYNGETILTNTGFIFGKPFGPTVGLSKEFTQESITQGLVILGCNGYLIPRSNDAGILITPDNYSFEDFVAEVQKIAPIGCNENYCSFLTAINNLSTLFLLYR